MPWIHGVGWAQGPADAPRTGQSLHRRIPQTSESAKGEEDGRRDRTARDLEKTEREIRRLIEAIKSGVPGAAVKDEMAVLEARRVELLARLEAAPPPMPRLHPNLAELYRQKVINLAEALNDDHPPRGRGMHP